MRFITHLRRCSTFQRFSHGYGFSLTLFSGFRTARAHCFIFGFAIRLFQFHTIGYQSKLAFNCYYFNKLFERCKLLFSQTGIAFLAIPVLSLHLNRVFSLKRNRNTRYFLEAVHFIRLHCIWHHLSTDNRSFSLNQLFNKQVV